MGQFKVGSCLANSSKMQFLVVLLSASLVYGAANPGGHHFGHAYHDGPHCHDKKDYQCHKTPKQQNHEECFVDYDIVVDVTYIEECEYLSSLIVLRSMNRSTTTLTLSRESPKLLMLIMNPMVMETMSSVLLMLETKDTPAVLTVRTRRSSSATSTPRKTPARSPSRLARILSTPSILRHARRESIHSAMKHMREDTTVLVVLLMILKALLLHRTLDTRSIMGGTITRNYT